MSHDTCHWQLPSVFPLTGLAPPPHLLEQLVLSVAHNHYNLGNWLCIPVWSTVVLKYCVMLFKHVTVIGTCISS